MVEFVDFVFDKLAARAPLALAHLQYFVVFNLLARAPPALTHFQDVVFLEAFSEGSAGVVGTFSGLCFPGAPIGPCWPSGAIDK